MRVEIEGLVLLRSNNFLAKQKANRVFVKTKLMFVNMLQQKIITIKSISARKQVCFF